jgi:uncharacterized membrane protein
MKRAYTRSEFKFSAIFAVAAAFAIMLSVHAFAQSGNFTVQAQEVRPTDGAFVFPLSTFDDGKARHFVYKHSPKEWIRFFVVKSQDGQTRAAFDACDVCWRQKKGYVQQGNEMVCVNCGMRFKTEKINEVKGGCNPAPLNRSISGSNLVISQQDVMSGVGFFQ